MKTYNKLMSKLTLTCVAIVAIFLVSSCEEESTQPNNINLKEMQTALSLWEKCLAVAGADLTGGYGGAKAGGGIGFALGGPHGAAFGGVVGCCIGGCGASILAGKAVEGLVGNGVIDPASPYNSEPSNADTIGFIHNSLVKHVTISGWITPDSVRYFAMYNNSLTYLIGRGYDADTLSLVYPYSAYLSAISQFENIEDIDDVISIFNNLETNNLIREFIDDLFNDVATANGSLSNAISTVDQYTNDIDDLSISETDKKNLKYALSVFKYSLALWHATISIN